MVVDVAVQHGAAVTASRVRGPGARPAVPQRRLLRTPESLARGVGGGCRGAFLQDSVRPVASPGLPSVLVNELAVPTASFSARMVRRPLRAVGV